MGERAQPATLPTTAVEAAQLPAAAQKPSADTAEALLAGMSLSDAYVVAAIIYKNPRHKDAILAYVAKAEGNKAITEVLENLKWMKKQWSPEDDHSDGVHDRDELAGGPDATATWLIDYLDTNKPSSKGGMSPRRQAAWDTILAVAGAIGGRTATYGDLSWAQEAMHAFRLGDENEGASRSKDVIVPSREEYTARTGVDPSLNAEKAASAAANNQGMVCVAPDVFYDEILALGPGERLMIVLKVVPRSAGVLHIHQVMAANHDGTRYLYDPEGNVHMVEATEAYITSLFDKSDESVNLYTAAVVQGRIIPEKS